MPLPPDERLEDAARRYGSMRSFAAEYLRERIISGVLLPGESLQIDEIAQRLKVSATPVREALQSLRVEGFVDGVRGQGFRVHPITAADIEDVFLVHANVAGELAARAARSISDEQLRVLEALHYELLAAAVRGDVEALEARNNEFHHLLNHIVDAPRLRWLVALFSKYVPRNFYAQIEGWPEATRADHTQIIDAIKARDAEAARHAASEHIIHSGELLAAHFRSATASADSLPKL
ncbi:GntR family transcriptional regulator [Pseudoclavibacter sp. VKM Ac-2867]|uniref:GntR family transcriptional regulator n=1 Tax=Pseudoclavibacter sp. VKM Ac-2867 TaxID=2783829 RepID=UPI00188BBF5B|nr:GntR family transcriptional regulator [Pseudoclavibacter sp. VKM Ac-2867]MBF4460896.1 GntR family transcriptional regulator [Pseudoclavibacter sp. VKM Ac-2867]